MIETPPQVAADFNVHMALRNGTKRVRLKTINRSIGPESRISNPTFYSIGETRALNELKSSRWLEPDWSNMLDGDS
jgi:hypothetical protein